MKNLFLFNTWSQCYWLCLYLALACGSNSQPNTNSNAGKDRLETLFTELSAERTGIDFANSIIEDENINFYLYDYIYNGGGVAIGDINQDGLPDVYLCGNMVPNKLYLNKGDLRFEDITQLAGVGGNGGWSTGVTMADVNRDGLLDIYVCQSYNDEFPEKRANLLYINKGDLTFTEQAGPYGIADKNYSTQAAFFDYDLDGDLDLIVANHPRSFFLPFAEKLLIRSAPKLESSDRLYNNQGNGFFKEVTIVAGIQNYGFSLGLVAADMNQDGWPDIYIANDYEEPDAHYINNGDGTFSNRINETMKHISNFSMGADLADYNNDGLPDLLVLDLVAEDNYRQKTQMSAMAPADFWVYVESGFHYQYMHNTLQVNNGDGSFSEVGYLAGITNTDWSWAPLLADFDNDGWKDLFVSNGYRRDARDKDYEKKLEGLVDPKDNVLKVSIDEYLSLIPSTKLKNYYFRNNKDMSFSKLDADGLSSLSFSNGAAYGDLDMDGDLDLVVNNLMDTAFVYRNNISSKHNYLRIKLEGEGANLFGYGAKVTLSYGGQLQYQELTATRGYQSSVEPILHFGLGEITSVDLEVVWPDRRIQHLSHVEAGQVLSLRQQDAEAVKVSEPELKPLFTELEGSGIDFTHKENDYDDFKKEILLPHKMSQFGPNIAVGDVNGDGLEDFFVGGASWQSGALYLQDAGGNFTAGNNEVFSKNKTAEDMGCLLFDADGDDDLDLYVVSGGNEFPAGSPLLQDRLYLNDGSGNFTKSTDALPLINSSGSCVVAGDYDQDGDLDLFIGGRLVPGKYPFPARSYILNNKGGKFTDVTEQVAAELADLGMVTSAVWSDHNSDGLLDLIVVGEWMPVTLFTQTGARFEKTSITASTGWWNCIMAGDFDGDGDPDYVAGNLGWNYKYKATEAEPLHVYCHDFDNSGTLDIVLGYYNQGSCYPVRGRECSSEQMPNIKEKFPTYDAFGRASLADVYGEDLNEALHYEANYFASSYIENLGKGRLSLTPLPVQAQFSTVFGIVATDYNKDGYQDLIIAGNFYVSEVETGRADAGIGLCMTGDGKGNFVPVPVTKSGFSAREDVRDLKILKAADGSVLILVANNNGKLQVFRRNKSPSIVIR